jgi:hypothetical protein
MMAFYTQQADQILPIFGVSSFEEARDLVGSSGHGSIVISSDAVYMNPLTGSVDFDGNWDTLEDVVEVVYCSVTEAWVEA